MHEQDSTDPTGVRGDGAVPARSRLRKAHAALALRIQGASWAEVAETWGYPSARHALVACEKAMEKDLMEEDRDHLRKFAGARLDALLQGVWKKATDPKHEEHLTALTKARDIIDRQARLYGLDAPQEVMIHKPNESELEQWVAAQAARNAPQVIEYNIIDGEVLEDAEDEAI